MEQRENQETPLLSSSKPAPGSKYALACAVVASVTSIIYGYNRGVMSGAQMFIQADLGISDMQIEVMIGATSICSLIGSLAGGWTCDQIGRRRTIALSAAIFFTGSLVTSLASGYTALMVGQFIAGIAAGYGLVVAPVYIAEIAPVRSRGFLSSIPEIAGNSGILLSYIADFVLAGLPTRLSWRLMISFGAIPPIFLLVSMLAMPESPRWLVLHGHLEETRHVLTRTSHSLADADRRLLEIKEAVETSRDCTDTSTWHDLILRPTPVVRRILVAILGLQFFQQACGIATMVLYAPRVFKKVGIVSDTSILGATILLGVAKTAFLIIPMFLADRVGRRPLLLASASGMAASLLILGLAVHAPGRNSVIAAVVCVTAAVAFMATFSIGFGPIIWVYGSEILPLRLRAQGAGLGTAVNRVVSAVVGMTFISLYEAITMPGSFYLFAAIAAAAWVFVYVWLPETKGRSLEDMEVLFTE